MALLHSWQARLRKIAPEQYVLLALFLLALGLAIWAFRLLPRPLEVIALDVGKGDCLLIRSPAGKTVLIDAGSSDRPSVGERTVVPNLYLLGVRRLDAIIITHPDGDHINGLPAVLQSLPVSLLLDAGAPSESSDYQRLLATARDRGVDYRQLHAGQRLNLGQGARLTMLAPAPGESVQGNDGSVVSLLQYRRARMLFTGDLEADGEARLLARTGNRLQADILKVAHHGSRSSSTQTFLQAVQPRYAIISSPGGTDGLHPSSAVLARLRRQGAQIIRTDVVGQIRLRSDGYRWRVQTFRQK